MSASLPREYLDQGVLLDLVSAVVHIEGDLPFDLHHVTGAVDREHSAQSIEVNVSKATLIDMPGE
jgi:hypothetical protein